MNDSDSTEDGSPPIIFSGEKSLTLNSKKQSYKSSDDSAGTNIKRLLII